MSTKMRTLAIWIGLVVFCAVPVVAAAFSPLLAWRKPIYIVAGFAGVIAMVLLLLQLLLASRKLPGITSTLSVKWHRAVGISLVFLVIVHVAGLWITSPPDVIDALLFQSPTPFSFWGVISMWALLLSAGIALLRRKLPMRVITWQVIHRSLSLVIVAGTVVHALLIEGTMEFLSKVMLSTALVLIALAIWINAIYCKR